MRRGPYSLDLKKQIKVRLDDITFEKITKVSEEQETYNIVNFERLNSHQAY